MFFKTSKQKTITGSRFSVWSIVAAIAGLVITLNTYAISGNNDEPIHIKANSAQLNESNGTAVYEGNVIITQGSASLTADKVQVISKERALVRIEAHGTPARLVQKAEGEKPETNASGKMIIYLHEEQSIQLRDNAKLVQGNNQFQGKTIDYNSITRTVSAQGSSSSEEKDGRVELIIHPKQLMTPKKQADSQEEVNKE